MNALECGNGKKDNQEPIPPSNARISYSVATLSSPNSFFPIRKTASHAHEQRKLQMGGNNPTPTTLM
jgi:hypothetical protein